MGLCDNCKQNFQPWRCAYGVQHHIVCPNCANDSCTRREAPDMEDLPDE